MSGAQEKKYPPGLRVAIDDVIARIRTADYDAALALCRDALASFPGSVDAVHLMAYLLQAKGEHQGALQYFLIAGQLEPDNVEVLNNHANSLKALGRYDEAEHYYRRAIEADGRFALAHHNLGELLLVLDRPAEAIARARSAAELQPELANPHSTLANALHHLGRYDEAIAEHRAYATHGGRNAAARLGEALVRLHTGDFGAGWELYEARLEDPGGGPLAERFELPRWRGAALARRSLLVVREQGLGDELMFASCLPDAIDAAERCLVTCDARLEKLFARSFPRASVLSGTQEALRERLAAEPADYQVPAGSLPLAFRTRAADFPAHAGYLRADPERVAHWRERLAGLGPGPKIALGWRGGMVGTGQLRRSVRLRDVLGAVARPDARFVSVQRGGKEIDAEVLAASDVARVEQWPEVPADLDETAALMCAADLTLTVCNAMAHLAGALGREAWVLTPASAEWRYGASGERMIWYPSVRVFRQPAIGDWGAVFARVRAELAARWPA